MKTVFYVYDLMWDGENMVVNEVRFGGLFNQSLDEVLKASPFKADYSADFGENRVELVDEYGEMVGFLLEVA